MNDSTQSPTRSRDGGASPVLRFAARLGSIDRRWIFLAMALAVAVPIVLELKFPEVPGRMARATFDAIEKVPEGSRVLLSFDYDPASEGELQPMANAIVHHCASRRHKIAFMALWPVGKQMADQTIREVLQKFHPEYKEGEDFVQLGYKTGNEIVVRLMSTNIPLQYPADAAGTPLGALPMMAGVESLRDFKLVASVSAGYPGAKEWVQFGNGPMPEAFTVVTGSTGVQVSQLLPYYPAQMEGLLVAVKGAAEYEMLVSEKYPVASDAERLAQGRIRMGPQLVAHLLVIGLIILGNISMLANRAIGGAR
jgi:hypothetical protein